MDGFLDQLTIAIKTQELFLKFYWEQMYQNMMVSTSLRTLSAQVSETLTQLSLKDKENGYFI